MRFSLPVLIYFFQPFSGPSRIFSEADAIAKASDESLAFATRLRKLGDPPSCSTALFDARNGKMYHGISGVVHPEKTHRSFKERSTSSKIAMEEEGHPQNLAQ